MLKNNKILIIGIIAFIAAMCYGATSSPWDGTTWDVTAPDIDQPIGNHYKEMYDLRKGVGIRIDKEHITLAGSSAGGEHLQGSARVWFQDAVPALQPDGTALAATDNGMLWIDTNATPDNLAYVLVDFSDPTVGNGWILLSVSTTAEIVAGAHQWADVQTFDVQAVHTLGLLSNGPVTLGAGADLVGSATSAINMNAFDVDENGVGTIGTSFDIAGTIAVVGTIDDDTMGTATDTTVATSESVKAYVDNEIVSAFWSTWSVNDSTADALLKDHTYEMQEHGFITVTELLDTGESLTIWEHSSAPATGGTVLAKVTSASTNDWATLFLAVRSGRFFEVVSTNPTATEISTMSLNSSARPIDRN